jgi:23S rRNA (cytosine1962-C5)-methyltransferase
LQEEKFIMFQNRLAKVFRHLGKQARKQNITCFRVYDHDLPEFPFCIEIYEGRVYAAEYRRRHGMEDEEHELWLSSCKKIISSVLEIPGEMIFLKERKRKQGRGDQYQKLDTASNEFIVHENGLKFLINLSNYLDTGLFLDHRITRQLVKQESSHKKILNLFAYTGSFSVYAASGAASEVCTVDLSKTYLEWAKTNFRLNGFELNDRFQFIHADVLKYLKEIAPASYDLVILDPPTFSNSQRMDDVLDIQRDHVGLINDCIRILRADGVVYFSTNFTRFILDAERLHAGEIKDITRMTTPFDFEGKLGRVCYRLRK